MSNSRNVGIDILGKPINIFLQFIIALILAFSLASKYWRIISENTPIWTFKFSISVFSIAFILMSLKLFYELRQKMTEDYIDTPEEVYREKYGETETKINPFLQKLEQKLENIGARHIQKQYGILPKLTFSFPIDHQFDTYQKIVFTVEEDHEINVNAELKYKLPFYFSIRKKVEQDLSSKKAKRRKLFTQTYSISSNNHKFTNLLLEETLIDEVLSEHESYINQIAVHGKSLTATFSSLDSVELFFILLSTILKTYTR